MLSIFSFLFHIYVFGYNFFYSFLSTLIHCISIYLSRSLSLPLLVLVLILPNVLPNIHSLEKQMNLKVRSWLSELTNFWESVYKLKK